MKRHLLFTVFMTIFISCITAQHKRFDDFFDSSHFKPVKLSSATLSPQRIVWVSTTDKNTISAPDNLLKPFDGQLATNTTDFCTFFKQEDTDTAAVILDFGREIYGNIRIFAPIRSDKKTVRIRVRLGESVSETMSETGGTTADSSATNDHSLRDYILEIPWLGSIETGQSGFRFVRIDLLDKGVKLPLKTVQAICRYRDIPYLGSFHCNDERLNRIWETGAYTVHLNMQEYLWDGIKRDRLVWLGDMHPEVMTITSVFGNNEVITKSLDFARDNTPLPGWMNDMCAYSLWWLIIHRDLYLYSGNYEYLKKTAYLYFGIIAANNQSHS